MAAFLDTSFLISKLVQRLRPNDLKSLSLAVDLLRSFSLGQPDFNPNVFRIRWTSSLETQGSHAQIKIVERNMNCIVMSTTRPNAIFLLLDHLRHSRESNHADFPVAESALPTDFIFVLQGLEGSNFKWNSRRNRFVSSDHMNSSLLELTRRVSEVGCMVRYLQEYTGYVDSSIHQHIISFVRDLLIEHFNFVAAIEAGFQKLTRNQLLSLLMSPNISRLRATAAVLATLQENRMESPYNILDRIASHGDPVITEVSLKMRDKSMEGIELMIKSWASKGEVDDPFSEFFVRCKRNVVVYSNWWHDCYFIAQDIVPSVLTQLEIDLMMSAGKALNFVRKFDQPVELSIDRLLPLPEFLGIAAAESNRHILNLIMKDRLFTDAIADIHNFMLLRRGDFASEFLDQERQSRFQFFVKLFVGRPVPNLTYREGDKEGFAFDAKPPLSAILGPYELQAYKAVSMILLRVRRAIEFAKRIERKEKPMHILWFEMTNFLNLVYDFFQTQVILKSYSRLQEVITDPGLTFDKLLQEHSTHTSNIARGCWASKSGQECRESLYEVLEVIEGVAGKPVPPVEGRQNLHQALFKFRTMLLGHHVSGRALVGALTNRFRNVFG
jgi:hypothetical protein